MTLDSASLRLASAGGAALRAPFGSHSNVSRPNSLRAWITSLDSASLVVFGFASNTTAFRLGGFAASADGAALRAPFGSHSNVSRRTHCARGAKPE